jgi:hypothetical protein
MSSFRRGAWALIVFAGIGCDQKKQTGAPAPAAMPPLDQPGGAAASGTSSRPTHEPTTPGNEGGGALPAGHPPIGAGESGSTAAAPGFEGATPVVEFDPKTVLAGVIKLDAKMKDKVQAGDTIFLVARRFDPASAPGAGTPLAVKKLTVAGWPLAFTLDSRDAMIAGTKIEGKVYVTARVDKDGDAITKNPGDVTGQSKPLAPPSKTIVVPLDTLL